jgi:hypothetical protein
MSGSGMQVVTSLFPEFPCWPLPQRTVARADACRGRRVCAGSAGSSSERPRGGGGGTLRGGLRLGAERGVHGPWPPTEGADGHPVGGLLGRGRPRMRPGAAPGCGRRGHARQRAVDDVPSARPSTQRSSCTDWPHEPEAAPACPSGKRKDSPGRYRILTKLVDGHVKDPAGRGLPRGGVATRRRRARRATGTPASRPRAAR